MYVALSAIKLVLAALVACYVASLVFVIGGNLLSLWAARARPMNTREAAAFGQVAPSPASRIGGIFAEAWYQTMTVRADLTRWVIGRPRLPSLDTGTPVLVLPGYLESTGSMVYLGRWLRSRGFRVVLEEFPSTFAPVADNSKFLLERIRELRAQTGAPEIAVVAHSMGGVITRNLIHTYPGDHGVKVLVCFASPHQGVSFAALAPGRSVQDMRFDSEHNNALSERVARARADVPIHAIVAVQEQVVTPPWAAMTEDGDTLVLPEALGHVGPLFARRAREQAEVWLIQAGVERAATEASTSSPPGPTD